MAEDIIRESIYPNLHQDAPHLNLVDEGHKYRLQRVRDIQTDLSNRINHYQRTHKRYKRAYNFLHNTSMTLGALSTVLSSSALAVGLTGVGIFIGAGMAGVAGILGIVSVSTGVASKRINKKVLRHRDTVITEKHKRNLISGLVSKALDDGKISMEEFNIILSEWDNSLSGVKKQVPINEKKDDEKKEETLRLEIKQALLKELSENLVLSTKKQ